VACYAKQLCCFKRSVGHKKYPSHPYTENGKKGVVNFRAPTEKRRIITAFFKCENNFLNGIFLIPF